MLLLHTSGTHVISNYAMLSATMQAFLVNRLNNAMMLLILLVQLPCMPSNLPAGTPGCWLGRGRASAPHLMLTTAPTSSRLLHLYCYSSAFMNQPLQLLLLCTCSLQQLHHRPIHQISFSLVILYQTTLIFYNSRWLEMLYPTHYSWQVTTAVLQPFLILVPMMCMVRDLALQNSTKQRHQECAGHKVATPP